MTVAGATRHGARLPACVAGSVPGRRPSWCAALATVLLVPSLVACRHAADAQAAPVEEVLDLRQLGERRQSLDGRRVQVEAFVARTGPDASGEPYYYLLDAEPDALGLRCASQDDLDFRLVGAGRDWHRRRLDRHRIRLSGVFRNEVSSAQYESIAVAYAGRLEEVRLLEVHAQTCDRR